MRRGFGLFAVLIVVALLAGGVAADELGPARPATSTGSARSGVWICPHGGGKDWSVSVTLANPGDQPVRVLATVLGDGPPERLESVEVPAGGASTLEVPATGPGTATYVEYFGGWVGAGWIARAPDPVVGIGSEPCLPASSTTWYATEPSTERGSRAWLVVANPHAADAVFDVALFSPSTEPLRDRDLTGVVLRGGRSRAFRLEPRILGEAAVGVLVDVKVGRVAVATTSVTEGGGVRSTAGVPEPAASWVLPTAAGSGQSSLLTLTPGDEDVLTFTTSLLTSDPAEVSAGSLEVSQGGGSTQATPIAATGPSSVQVSTSEGAFVAAIRSEGRVADDAATAGAAAPAPEWLVPPTVAGDPARPGLVIVNTGSTDVGILLTLLPADPDDAGSMELDVPAGSAVAVPAEFFADAPRSAALVQADAPVVALGASTSGGKDGLSLYGLALGVPVPAWVIGD